MRESAVNESSGPGSVPTTGTAGNQARTIGAAPAIGGCTTNEAAGVAVSVPRHREDLATPQERSIETRRRTGEAHRWKAGDQGLDSDARRQAGEACS